MTYTKDNIREGLVFSTGGFHYRLSDIDRAQGRTTLNPLEYNGNIGDTHKNCGLDIVLSYLNRR